MSRDAKHLCRDDERAAGGKGGASPACFPSGSDLVCMHKVAFATKLASSCGKHRSLNFIPKLATKTKTLRVFHLYSRWELSDGTFLHINIFIAHFENSEVTQLHCQHHVPRDSSPCYFRAFSPFPTSWSVVQLTRPGSLTNVDCQKMLIVWQGQFLFFFMLLVWTSETNCFNAPHTTVHSEIHGFVAKIKSSFSNM